MKRILCFVLCAVLLTFVMSGCTSGQTTDPDSTQSTTTAPSDPDNPSTPGNDLPQQEPAPKQIGFRFQRIDSVSFAPADGSNVVTVRSKAELDALHQQNESRLTDRFIAATQTYDSEFFTDHTLVLVSLSSTYCSIYHEVSSVIRQGNGDYGLYLNEIWPEIVSPAGEVWCVIVEVDERIPEDAQVTFEVNSLDLIEGSYQQNDGNAQPQQITFTAQRMAAGGYPSALMSAIRSVSDLDHFYRIFGNNTSKYDITEVKAKYDDAFFANHTLLILSVRSENALERQEVTQIVKQSDDRYTVYLDRITDADVSDEAEHWHIFVEIEGCIEKGPMLLLDVNKIKE